MDRNRQIDEGRSFFFCSEPFLAIACFPICPVFLLVAVLIERAFRSLNNACYDGRLSTVMRILAEHRGRWQRRLLRMTKPGIFTSKLMLHLASSRGYLDIVEHLLDCGADINAVCEGDQTALHQACENGRFKIVKHLVERGAKLELKDRNGRTPFHSCAIESRIAIMQYLIQKGADRHALDADGQSPLGLANSFNSVAAVEYLENNQVGWDRT